MIGLAFFHWWACRFYSGGSEPVCSDLGQALTNENPGNCCYHGNWGQDRKAGFPGGPDSKEPACNGSNPGLIPGWGRPPLERGMAAHSSVLAWRIPWTEEPGGLQSMGSQTVGHNWAISTFTLGKLEGRARPTHSPRGPLSGGQVLFLFWEL